jgi:hypothetical protein
MRHAVLITLLLLIGMPQQGDPYSCRLLDDEMRKCSFDPHCDRRVVERLRQECVRDGLWLI